MSDTDSNLFEDLGDVPLETQALRVKGALDELLARTRALQEATEDQLQEFGAITGDTAERALLLATSAQVWALTEAVVLLGSIVATDLSSRR